MKIKKGDKVKIITGKDKSKSGTVLRALPRENKVIVEGVAVAKKHLKGRSGNVGHIAERPRPIDASNVKKIEEI